MAWGVQRLPGPSQKEMVISFYKWESEGQRIPGQESSVLLESRVVRSCKCHLSYLAHSINIRGEKESEVSGLAREVADLSYKDVACP